MYVRICVYMYVYMYIYMYMYVQTQHIDSICCVKIFLSVLSFFPVQAKRIEPHNANRKKRKKERLH